MAFGPVIRPTDLTEVAEGIFYTAHPLPMADETLINLLKNAARSTLKRRARLCAHPSANAEQHDMLIVSHRETYVAPHRHPGKAETFVVLEGIADVMLFDDRGILSTVIKMG